MTPPGKPEIKIGTAQIKVTIMVKRIDNTGNYAADWQFVGANIAAVGAQALTITQAEAQSAMDPTNAIPVDPIDPAQNQPALTIP